MPGSPVVKAIAALIAVIIVVTGSTAVAVATNHNPLAGWFHHVSGYPGSGTPGRSSSLPPPRDGTVPMPPTLTTCPQTGKARAALIEPLALGEDQNIVFVDSAGSFEEPGVGTVVRYDVSTGQTATVPIPSTFILEAQVSTDGKWVMLTTTTGGHDAVQLMRMDGLGLQTLYCTLPHRLLDAQWSPDQATIALAVLNFKNTGPSTTIYLLTMKDGHLRALTTFSGPQSSCCVQLSWLDDTHLTVIGSAGITDNPDSGNPLLLDTSQPGTLDPDHLPSLFSPTMPPDGSDFFGQQCYDFASSSDRTRVFVSQCTLTRYFPMAADAVVANGPSSIAVQSVTGGTEETIYRNPEMAITALQSVSPTKLIFSVENFSSQAGQQVDAHQNGLWTINTDGSGLTHLTSEAIGETGYFFFLVPPPTWLDVSRDGRMYAYATSNFETGNQSFFFGSLAGGNPTTFLSKASSDESVRIAGWTAM